LSEPELARSSLFHLLNQNWVSLLVSLLATILGAYWAKARSRLSTQVNTLSLIGQNPVFPAEIGFTFKGVAVPTVTLTRVAIWNAGNTTIRGEQIVNRDRLRVVTSAGSSVLDAVVLGHTRSVNDVSCSIDPGAANQVNCTFDYLDYDDGALLQIVHTGTDHVEVTGTLRGIPKGLRRVGIPKKKAPPAPSQTAMTRNTATTVGMLLLFIGIWIAYRAAIGPPLGPWPQTAQLDPDAAPTRTEGVVLGVIAGALGCLCLWSRSRIPPSILSTEFRSEFTKKSSWMFWRAG
jgi:hypothetical protein